MSIFSIDGLCLAFGTHVLLDHASFSLESGERVCLIGRNGTGKTTLMRLIQGEMQADEGDLRKKDGLTVSSLSQEVPYEACGNVFDIVASGLGDTAQLLQDYNHVLHDVANGDEKALKKMERIQHELESVDGWSLVQRVEETITRLQLSGDDLIENMSGGLKRRIMLAKALVIEPDILMLDEPTNHLDIESILWLENFLKTYKGCVLFITHDRIFLQNVATRILELDRGQLVSFPCDYQTYLRRKEEMLHAEEKANELFDKKLADEEVWIRQGIKARRTRNEGRVRALKSMREERSQRRDVQGKAKLELDDKKNSGKLVVEVDKISYEYENKPIVKDFSTVIMRGDRIGIIGPNGVGKTTVLNLLLGELAPQTGAVKLGTKLEIAYFDQLRDQLDDEKSIVENIGQGREFVNINGRDRHVFSYLSDFLFSSERAKVSVKALSGGERNRLLLAKLFTKPANLLVLDEPTNDLDSETLELLEALLIEYKGTLIIVSHDRAFLNNVITSSLVFEANGINEYVGGYDDWLRQRKPAAAENKQVKKQTQQGKPDSSVNSSTVVAPKKIIKLSYKEQRELDNLPGKIEKFERQQSELETEVAAPEFYQQDQKNVARKLSELEAINQQLESVYERWDELEAKKE